ncbi:Sulfiredoxin [Wickerhamomyces ciferrii]|uniref:Sulfiredoxin n=1 Tax=Wickerhamomyces ciferrii (strain ATCC 14091 / BCRC 22168 / CBS 111 / JCM 3599 / NBRC 0793 / NRRL Y-1031 F-60-10) TaxID=1206466 RepID=K0KS21_WICCF|nr:Sulfiredoxin [Wickerhamomyces ciferrii]CCH44762.1 Sulfiredoxin [Wickerhamomyces ciferrii]
MSIQSGNIGKISYLPLNQIKRPIPPVLDYDKIDSMESQLKGIPMASKTCSLEEARDLNGELPPIDVMAIKENDEIYYFAFGGCHRFQAYERIGPDAKVKCKILPATKRQLKLYLGGSVDHIFEKADGSGN